MLKGGLFAALLAACVPSAEDTEPRGGVVARLVPSAETSGRPFQSADGWTVTIEKFAIRAALAAERRINGVASYAGGVGRPRILTPREDCELLAVAIGVGPAEAYLDLQPRYSGYEEFKNESVCGVDPELLPFFNRKADSPDPSDSEGIPDSFQNAPSLVLLGRAEKNGRSIRLELAVEATTYGDSGDRNVQTVIVANQGALVRIGVDASALFLATGPDSQVVPFDRVAAADTNGDGTVTGAELAVAKTECYSRDFEEEEGFNNCDTLLASIVYWNAQYMLGRAP